MLIDSSYLFLMQQSRLGIPVQQISLFLGLKTRKTRHPQCRNFCLTTSIAFIASTLNQDFSFDHVLFVTENVLSTEAILHESKRQILQYNKEMFLERAREKTQLNSRNTVLLFLRYYDIFLFKNGTTSRTTGRPKNTEKTRLSRSKRYVWSA